MVSRRKFIPFIQIGKKKRLLRGNPRTAKQGLRLAESRGREISKMSAQRRATIKKDFGCPNAKKVKCGVLVRRGV